MAKKYTIDAKVPANKENGTPELSGAIAVEFPDLDGGDAALEEAKKLYGAAALLSNAFANWKITLQSNIRNALKRGENSPQIQARLGSAKMGVATKGARVDPLQAYLAAFQSASPAEQKKMLAELQARASK